VLGGQHLIDKERQIAEAFEAIQRANQALDASRLSRGGGVDAAAAAAAGNAAAPASSANVRASLARLVGGDGTVPHAPSSSK
jgi:hypothetical protein